MKTLAGLAAGCCALFGLIPVTAALGRSPSVEIAIITNRDPSGFHKKLPARVVARGPFVVGQPATLSVGGMPKSASVFVDVQAIASTPACSQLLCIPTSVIPDENAPEIHFAHTSRRGRATLTFTMPTTFEAFPIPTSGRFPKGPPREIPWGNDQAVQVVVWGGKLNHRGDLITGVAGTKTTVQAPQPASTP